MINKTLKDFRRMADSFKRSPERETELLPPKVDVSAVAKLNKRRYKHYLMKQEVSGTINFITQVMESEALHQMNDFFCTETNLFLEPLSQKLAERSAIYARRSQENKLNFLKIPKQFLIKAENQVPKREQEAKPDKAFQGQANTIKMENGLGEQVQMKGDDLKPNPLVEIKVREEMTTKEKINSGEEDKSREENKSQNHFNSQFRARASPSLIRPSSTFKELFTEEVPLKPPQRTCIPINVTNPNDISLEKLNERRSRVKQQRSSEDRIDKSLSEKSKVLDEIKNKNNADALARKSPGYESETRDDNLKDEEKARDIKNKNKSKQVTKAQPKRKKSRRSQSIKEPSPVKENGNLNSWNSSTLVSNSKKKSKVSQKNEAIPVVNYELRSKWPKSQQDKNINLEKTTGKMKEPFRHQIKVELSKSKKKNLLSNVKSTPQLLHSPNKSTTKTNETHQFESIKQSQGRRKHPLERENNFEPENDLEYGYNLEARGENNKNKIAAPFKVVTPIKKDKQKGFQTEPGKREKWKLDQCIQTSEAVRLSNKAIQTSLHFFGNLDSEKVEEDDEEEEEVEKLERAIKNERLKQVLKNKNSGKTASPINKIEKHRKKVIKQKESYEEDSLSKEESINIDFSHESISSGSGTEEGPIYLELKLDDILGEEKSQRKKQGKGRKNKELLKLLTLEDLLKKAALVDEGKKNKHHPPKNDKSATSRHEDKSVTTSRHEDKGATSRHEAKSATSWHEAKSATSRHEEKGATSRHEDKSATSRHEDKSATSSQEDKRVEDFFPRDKHIDKQPAYHTNRQTPVTIKSDKVPKPFEADHTPKEEVIEISLQSVPIPGFSSAEKIQNAQRNFGTDSLYGPRKVFEEKLSLTRQGYGDPIKNNMATSSSTKPRSSVSPLNKPQVDKRLIKNDEFVLGKVAQPMKEDLAKRSRYDLKSDLKEEYSNYQIRDSERRATNSLEKMKRLFDSVADRNPLEMRPSNVNSSKINEDEENLKLFYKYQKMYAPEQYSTYEERENSWVKPRNTEYDSPREQMYIPSVMPFRPDSQF